MYIVQFTVHPIKKGRDYMIVVDERHACQCSVEIKAYTLINLPLAQSCMGKNTSVGCLIAC